MKWDIKEVSTKSNAILGSIDTNIQIPLVMSRKFFSRRFVFPLECRRLNSMLLQKGVFEGIYYNPYYKMKRPNRGGVGLYWVKCI